MRESNLTKTVSYVIVFVVLILYLFPLLNLFNVAMKTNQEFMLSSTSLAKSLHLHNFVDAWKQGGFSKLILNSLIYTISATFLTVTLSFLAAFPISRQYVRWSGFFYAFFLMSLFLPNALIPQFNLIRDLGLYNTQIGYILLKASGTGIVFILFVGYIKTISKELDEAAGIDGCGYLRYLSSIVFPLTKPVLATGIVLSAIGVWNDLIGPLIYLTDKKFFPVTQGLIKFQGQYQNNWPLLACGVLIVSLPLILLYAFLQRFIIEGTLSGAIKA
jgi:raffinose/stachyose/melibiose transport system permease protein